MLHEQVMCLLKKVRDILAPHCRQSILEQNGKILSVRSGFSILRTIFNAGKLDVCISNIDDENQGISSLSQTCLKTPAAFSVSGHGADLV